MTRFRLTSPFYRFDIRLQMTAYSSLAIKEPMTSAVHSSFSKRAEIQMAGLNTKCKQMV